VQAALVRLAALDPGRWQGAQLVTRATESGVAPTPLHDDELRRGARQRAETLAAGLLRRGEPADLYLGLEGGVHVEVGSPEVAPAVWLRSWCYAWDGAHGTFGCGPSVRLPECIASPVRDGEDLAAVLDRVAGGEDLRSRDGTWGYVTRGMLTRALAFETAVLAALAPYYHPQAFARAVTSAAPDPTGGL
jgi:non-canonical (house-cleaning) NTP pyrophosphatase